MKSKLLICLVAACLIVPLAWAGWQHLPDGGTTWIDKPTPTTLWYRDLNGYLVIAPQMQVFPDTIQYAVGIETGKLALVHSSGFWTTTNPTNGYVTPNKVVIETYQVDGRHRGIVGTAYDIEWGIRITNGAHYLYPLQ